MGEITKAKLSDLKQDDCNFNKAMVTPIQYPSAIYAEMQVMNGNRIHHRIQYKFLAPMIIKRQKITSTEPR